MKKNLDLHTTIAPLIISILTLGIITALLILKIVDIYWTSYILSGILLYWGIGSATRWQASQPQTDAIEVLPTPQPAQAPPQPIMLTPASTNQGTMPIINPVTGPAPTQFNPNIFINPGTASASAWSMPQDLHFGDTGIIPTVPKQ